MKWMRICSLMPTEECLFVQYNTTSLRQQQTDEFELWSPQRSILLFDCCRWYTMVENDVKPLALCVCSRRFQSIYEYTFAFRYFLPSSGPQSTLSNQQLRQMRFELLNAIVDWTIDCCRRQLLLLEQIRALMTTNFIHLHMQMWTIGCVCDCSLWFWWISQSSHNILI